MSRTLKQVCYNLVNKTHTQKMNEHRERKWQTSGNKTFLLSGRLCFHFVYYLAQINRCYSSTHRSVREIFNMTCIKKVVNAFSKGETSSRALSAQKRFSSTFALGEAKKSFEHFTAFDSQIINFY